MQRDPVSDRFALAAALLLLITVILNDARVMLAASVVGLAAGLLVAHKSTLTRAAVAVVVGLAVACGIAVFQMVR